MVAASASTKFCFSTKAYGKILAHAAKYPWADVNGVLVGRMVGSSDCDPQVDDVILLFHTPTLTPMLQTAMSLVEAYCESDLSPAGTRIVGYYHCNARADRSTIPPLAARVATTLTGRFPNSCLVMVDGAALANETESGLSMYKANASSGWSSVNSTQVEVEGGSDTFIKATALLCDHDRVASVVDFDECFEDISLDWRNASFVL